MQPWLVRYIVPADVPIIGGQDLSIPTYLFMATVGLMLALWVVVREADRQKLEPRGLIDLSLFMTGGGLIVGRVGQLLTGDLREVMERPLAVLDLFYGGTSSAGALLGAFIVAAVYCKKKKLSLIAALDVMAPAFAFGMIFVRIGALGAGSAYGRPIDFPWGFEWPWGVVFYGKQVPVLLQGVALHPTQLYLALGNLLIFLGLLAVARRRSAVGQVVAAWAVAYGLMRMVIDVFRFDMPLYGGWVSIEQIAAAILLIVGLVFLLRLRRSAGDAPSPSGPSLSGRG